MDGGAPVTEYTVEMSEADQGSRRQLYQGPETDCTASNLLPGQTYCFWVKAANQAGVRNSLHSETEIRTQIKMLGSRFYLFINCIIPS